MNNNKNAFKMTKAESDMRQSSRELDEWLKTKNNAQKTVKPQTNSIQQPNKNAPAQTKAKSNSATLSASSSSFETKPSGSVKINKTASTLDSSKKTQSLKSAKQMEWRAKQESDSSGNMQFRPSPQYVQEFRKPVEKKSSSTDKENKADVGDFFGWLGKNALSGVSSFNRGVMGTLDAILPTEILGKYDFVSELNDFYSREHDRVSAEAKQASMEMGGKGWEFAGDVVASTVSAIPTIALGFMSGGAGTAGTLAKSGKALVKTGVGFIDDIADGAKIAYEISKSAIKNPANIIDAVQTYGNEYNDALSYGASEAAAINSAISNTAINFALGEADVNALERILKNKGYSKGVQYMGRLADDGLMESLEGVVDSAISSAAYNRENPIFSFDDEGAIINPKRMAVDFAGGATSRVLSDTINRIINPSDSIINKKGKNTAKRKSTHDPIFPEIQKAKSIDFDILQINSEMDELEATTDKSEEESAKYINSLSDEEFEEYIKRILKQ